MSVNNPVRRAGQATVDGRRLLFLNSLILNERADRKIQAQLAQHGITKPAFKAGALERILDGYMFAAKRGLYGLDPHRVPSTEIAGSLGVSRSKVLRSARIARLQHGFSEEGLFGGPNHVKNFPPVRRALKRR